MIVTTIPILMEIKVELLIEILIANRRGDLILKALEVMIEDKNGGDYVVGSKIMVQIFGWEFPEDEWEREAGVNYTGECMCVGYNRLKIENQYLVLLPNGSTRWTSKSDRWPEQMPNKREKPSPFDMRPNT